MSIVDDAKIMALLVGMYKEVDTDSNGVIDFEEFTVLTRDHLGLELSPKDLKETFDLFDEDGSGAIEFLEFVNILESCGLRDELKRVAADLDLREFGMSESMTPLQLRIHVFFMLADLDRDGSLSSDEIYLALRNIQGDSCPTREEILDKIKDFDKDGSGTLDIHEFQALIQSLD